MSNKKEKIIMIPDIHSTDMKSCEMMVTVMEEVCETEVVIQSDDFGNIERRVRTQEEKKKDLGANMARIQELRTSQEDIVIPSGTTMKEATGKVRSAFAVMIRKKETIRCRYNKNCQNMPNINKKKNEPFKFCQQHFLTIKKIMKKNMGTSQVGARYSCEKSSHKTE